MIALIRRALSGEQFVSAKEAFTVGRNVPFGHVRAVLGTLRKLGLEPLIASKRSRERDLVVALIAERILHPSSKLGTARLWGLTALGDELGVGGARVNEVYAALDWLLGRQKRIEKKLAARHLSEGSLAFCDTSNSYRRERELDGFYVVRTSEPEDRLQAPGVVRAYKNLSQAERVFRCMKGVDLKVRPIYLATEPHVRAHFFLCMLAYYVEWHMREALAPLLFEEEGLQESRWTRDPVSPARSSRATAQKKATRTAEGGREVHSFDTLLQALATQCRNTCTVKSSGHPVSFDQITEASPLQARAYQLLGL